MVQKQTRRRSSLIMGAMLALLLGIAAGFVVLGMPTRMLEAVTTFTHLSKLMIQAEPPISPSDQTLLGALAGVLTAGIGWVLVDWLLFGRAGMRTLIREREDDYEDEEGEAFRPTDPLDLVTPVNLPTGDWAPQPAGDARRPLSARTDIGDPPKPTLPTGLQPAAMPGIDQLLPPIDQILPGAGGAAPPFPAPPQVQPPHAPDPFQQLNAEPQAANILGGPALPGAAPAPSWAPAEAPAGQKPPQPAASAPAWLPTPGVRPDGSQPHIDLPEAGDEDETVPFGAPTAQPEAPPLPLAPFNQTPPPLQLNTPEPPPLQLDTPAPPPLFTPPAAHPEMAPMPAPQPVPPPMFQPAAPQSLAFEPPVAQPPAFQPPAHEPPAAPFAQPPAFEPPPVRPPAPPVAAPQPPAPRRAASEPTFAGMDKARLEDLLARLERGLQARRAAAAQAAAAPVPAPQPPLAVPQPPFAEPQQPVAMPQPQFAAPRPSAAVPQPPIAAPRPSAAMPQPMVPAAPVAPETPASFDPPPPRPTMPPAGFAAPMPQPVAPTTAPVYDLPTMPVSPAYDLAPAPPVAEPFAPAPRVETDEPASDELLDQPLHMTLDLLRNKVKR